MRNQKIEMDGDGMVECSESKNRTTHKSTMATTQASNYWTATAQHVMQVPPTQEEEEAERWNQHKFGLCPICKVGLDDKSELAFNYANGSENGTMMCWDCDAKLKPKKTCIGCFADIEDKDVLVTSWDMRNRTTHVIRCTGCRH
jgi:hypothetical protein